MSDPTARTFAEACGVLTDPAFAVPPPPDDDPDTGVAWLRRHVARFGSGADHTRRRRLAEAELALTAPEDLQGRARERTRALLRAAPGGVVDLMAAIARPVPVETLAEAMGLPAGLAAPVAQAARAYPLHASPDAAADAAVDRLVDACGGIADEAAAARIGLLVQACDATAGLVGNAAAALLGAGTAEPGADRLTAVLHLDPPVRSTRRVAAHGAELGGARLPEGTPVVVDLAAANRDPHRPANAHLAFGAGPHRCPGADHAVAIAAGILEALDGCTATSREVAHEPSPNLRIPARLEVRTP